MTTDFRALCAKVAEALDECQRLCGDQPESFLVWKTRAALAEQPVGEGPPAVTTGAWLHPAYEPGDGSADGAQMVGLAWWHPQFGCDSLQMVVDNARAILARWGNPAPQPVPVSERLPGPEDCDSEGRCWWGEPQIEDSHDATWNLCTQYDAQEFLTWGAKCGWLPAHALPLPKREVSK